MTKALEAEAIADFCLVCPVRKECGEYADTIDAATGIWGGERRVQ